MACDRCVHAQGEHEKAAQLYQKAGRMRRALDMCCDAQLLDTLAALVDELTPGVVDPDTLARYELFGIAFSGGCLKPRAAWRASRSCQCPALMPLVEA